MDVNTYAMLMHLSQLLGYFVGPLILWLINKDKSEFIDKHGKAIMNQLITGAIVYVIGVITALLFIGIIVIWLWAVLSLIFLIMGAIAANGGKEYKYPLAIKFLK